MKYCLYTLLVFFIPLLSQAQTAIDTKEAEAQGVEDSTTTKIVRLKINSSKSDFSPVVIHNQLAFVSARNKDGAVQYVDVNNESEITDLYICDMQSPSKFKSVNSLSSVINTNYYEGPFCFNREGTVMYYTANDKRSSLLKIYRSEKTGDTWSQPVMLPFCFDEFSYCHPTLSPDGSKMIFSAGIQKEKKGMDLYMSENINGSWFAPVALRAEINDSANQVFPFISSSNVLYFSSDKKGGMGGLDIYRVSLDSASAFVRPLKHPLNSAADDFGIWVDSTSEAGYFSSNRQRKYKDDIFYFSKSIPDFSDAKTVMPKTKFCYSFFEESTLASKDTANLTYEWSFGDGTKGRGLKTRHCYAGPGDYEVQLNIVDKESGEVFMSQAAYPLTIERPDQLLISCPATVSAGTEISLSSTQCYLKGYELNKVFWSFGDGKYNSGPAVKHIYGKPGDYLLEAGVLAKNLQSGKTEQFKMNKQIRVNEPSYEK